MKTKALQFSRPVLEFFWGREKFLLQYWQDEFLQWDPNEFGGISSLHVPSELIWKPDLLVYNKLVVTFFSLIISMRLEWPSLVPVQTWTWRRTKCRRMFSLNIMERWDVSTIQIHYFTNLHLSRNNFRIFQITFFQLFIHQLVMYWVLGFFVELCDFPIHWFLER